MLIWCSHLVWQITLRTISSLNYCPSQGLIIFRRTFFIFEILSNFNMQLKLSDQETFLPNFNFCERVRNCGMNSQFFSPHERFHLVPQPTCFWVQRCFLWTHSLFGKLWLQVAVLKLLLPFWSVWPLHDLWGLTLTSCYVATINTINKLLLSTLSIWFLSLDLMQVYYWVDIFCSSFFFKVEFSLPDLIYSRSIIIISIFVYLLLWFCRAVL